MKKIWILIACIIIVLGAILIINIKSDDEQTSDINYEIITDRSIIRDLEINDAKKRGHEIIEKDGSYYLIINYGERSNYYSKLDVVNVEVNGKKLKVTVKLPDGEGMGEAFSYPNAIIKLDEKPEKVDIKYN